MCASSCSRWNSWSDSAGPEGAAVEQIAFFAAKRGPVEERAAAYACENHACRQPVTTPEDFNRILAGISRKD
jgi:uncharacterized protein YyaL (SSP411 family)